MLLEETAGIAAEQRRQFNRLVDVFDVPQPPEVIDRLRAIVAAAGVRPGEVVLDTGTGAGVVIPLISRYSPARVLACDVSERMLERVHRKFPRVDVIQADVVWCPLCDASVDVIFMNAMYGNIADKPAACAEAARILKRGGRLVVSHPEGKDFIYLLRESTDLFLEPFPTRSEFAALLTPFHLDIEVWRDEPKLYLMIARR